MQDVFLFSDAVKGNIAYGRPELDEESIVKRAVQADADGFIKQMESGYETLVGERGVGLSGGQRQRIALARALAVTPAVLILDDTTSAVDSETEQYIQDQLRNLDFPCTKIIIAQRISSFRGADQILVMDKGRIIERGQHKELLAIKGFYYYIWNLQYNTDIAKKLRSPIFALQNAINKKQPDNASTRDASNKSQKSPSLMNSMLELIKGVASRFKKPKGKGKGIK
jgi:ATP-binding cassette subfamily B protein